MFRRIPACDCRLCSIFAFRHHFCSHRCIQDCCLFPVRMLLQISLRLCQRLWMRIYLRQLFHLCARDPHQYMSHRDDLFPYNIMRIFHQKIIDIQHTARCGVFDRKHCIVGFALADRFHRVFPGLHMKALHFITEKFFHCGETVSPLHPLEDHRRSLRGDFLHLDIFRADILFCSREKLVLTFPAD